MEYKRQGNSIFVRIDRGEEVTEQIKAAAESESVRLGTVQGLGAIDDFTVGLFNTAEKRYQSNHFQGAFEIVSLTGTITTKDGAYYAHLHMSAGDEEGSCFGGHLNSARVSATCEVVITVLEGRVERRFSEETGLNLFCFD